ncbi:hypothetical protein ACFFJN_12060, partial [Erwinia mallotivora]|uniref:hypothetical protein n=1 Tax=Erwinia mallotivora TaxID=69222 RepID=UPI0035E488CE
MALTNLTAASLPDRSVSKAYFLHLQRKKSAREAVIRLFYQNKTQKTPAFWSGSSLYMMPGSSLLSHGETPHYHRRYG